MGLCDIQDIKAILGRHGFHFSKSLGQNFLTEQWVPDQIAQSHAGQMQLPVYWRWVQVWAA